MRVRQLHWLALVIAACFLTSELSGRVAEPPSGGSGRILPRKPYDPVRGAICKREEYPPGTPISGCRTDRNGRSCDGACYVHTLTLYFGSCYPVDNDSECKYRPTTIRVGGRKGACRIDKLGFCGCPPPEQMTPYVGDAEVFDC